MTLMSMNFNENSEKSRFIFKPNPLDVRTFDILENRAGYDEYEPAGSYVVLDSDEDMSLTEKKLINLMGLMNGKGIKVDLSGDVRAQTLYNVVPKKIDSDATKIIFRLYDGNGVSKENAILTVRRGVFDA